MQTMDLKITENFTLKEFLKSNIADLSDIEDQYIIDIGVFDNIRSLTTNILQPLRDKVGRVNITSGYRCEALNKLVGGVRNSQHLSGKAVDFKCSNLEQAIYVIKHMSFDQLIIYPTFLHVSFDVLRSRNSILYG